MSFPMSLVEEAPILGSDSDLELTVGGTGGTEQEQRYPLRGGFSESMRARFLLGGTLLGCLGLAIAVVSTNTLHDAAPGLTPVRSRGIEAKDAEPGASPFGSSPFGSTGIQTSSSWSTDGDAAPLQKTDPWGSPALQQPQAHFSQNDALAAVKAMSEMEDLMKGSFFSTRSPVTITPLPTAAPPNSQLSKTYCNPNEELYDNKCYKTCSSLTNGAYPLRTTPYSCCKKPCIGVSKNGGLPIPCTGFDIDANGECPKEVMAPQPSAPPQLPSQQQPVQQPLAQQNPQQAPQTQTPGFLPPQFPTN